MTLAAHCSLVIDAHRTMDKSTCIVRTPLCHCVLCACDYEIISVRFTCRVYENKHEHTVHIAHVFVTFVHSIVYWYPEGRTSYIL